VSTHPAALDIILLYIVTYKQQDVSSFKKIFFDYLSITY